MCCNCNSRIYFESWKSKLICYSIKYSARVSLPVSAYWLPAPLSAGVEKWSTEDNFVVCNCGKGGFHLFHLFQWWNNYQPSWQHRSNTVHHCTLKRRSLFINIKPIWAEKLQCPNDVYTSALMSLLSNIAALSAVFPWASLHRKD